MDDNRLFRPFRNSLFELVPEMARSLARARLSKGLRPQLLAAGPIQSSAGLDGVVDVLPSLLRAWGFTAELD